MLALPPFPVSWFAVLTFNALSKAGVVLLLVAFVVEWTQREWARIERPPLFDALLCDAAGQVCRPLRCLSFTKEHLLPVGVFYNDETREERKAWDVFAQMGNGLFLWC